MSGPFKLTDHDAATIVVAASRYLAGRTDGLEQLEAEIERVLDRHADEVSAELAALADGHGPKISPGGPSEVSGNDIVARRVLNHLIEHGDVRGDAASLQRLRQRVRSVVLTFDQVPT